ncbi:MAG: hypothetical protein QM779_17265 [Propionicimonas sp.]|uniref:hypothetical protein n=1 Tax=Propionicimonas sp. TaxID=1955623 RepID=UPI003D09B2B4
MRKFLVAAALTATLAVGAAAATPTTAAPMPQASTCTGVWVVVDYGSLGGTSTKCATSYGTGLAALKSAGFSVTIDDGFIYKINGKPSKPDTNQAYWSYWHATRKDDGSYSDWSYSNLGATDYHPTTGNAEGWRYQSLSDGKVPPAVAPPAADSTPSPTPTPTKTKTSKPTASATATRKPTATATATATRTTTSASASPTPSTTATSATPTTSGVASESASATAVDTASSEVAQDEVTGTAPPQDDAGSPVGAIVAGSAVVLAAAGLGGWWLIRRRRP